MMTDRTTFIGIHPTAGRKPLVYAALDDERSILALGEGSLEDVLAFVSGPERAFAAINSPRGPNCRLMADDAIRLALDPPPKPGRWQDYRVAEYLLRQHHIAVPPTPCQEQACRSWLRAGFELYRRLEKIGYRPFPSGAEPCQSLEVNPHAAFCALLGQAPFPKNSLEGQLQRQLVLNELRVRISDPMEFFEEVTRHRLLRGILPLKEIYAAAELDALVAAYTAWMAAHRPGEITLLGNAQEGQVVLPTAELKSVYA